MPFGWINNVMYYTMEMPLVEFDHVTTLTIGLAGCGIWLYFVVILGMQAENRSGMQEF